MTRRALGFFALASLVTLGMSMLSCGEDKSTNPSHDELNSPALLGSTSGSENYFHSFADKGTYPYHCTYHTTATHRMAGTVIVEDQGADSAFVSIFQGAFSPATVSVKPNRPVRWQNFDEGTHHTVTSD